MKTKTKRIIAVVVAVLFSLTIIGGIILSILFPKNNRITASADTSSDSTFVTSPVTLSGCYYLKADLLSSYGSFSFSINAFIDGKICNLIAKNSIAPNAIRVYWVDGNSQYISSSTDTNSPLRYWCFYGDYDSSFVAFVNTFFVPCFDVNMSNVLGSDTSNAYNSGYNVGYEAGHSVGYGSGRSDGYSIGYNSGYDEGLEDGISQGSSASYNEGYDDGYNIGQSDGYESGLNQGYDNGYDSGYDVGLEDGISQGYDTGYNDGNYDGYESGLNQGYDNGYGVGYNNGYDKGIQKGESNSVTNPITSFIEPVHSFMNTQFFGALTYASIFNVILFVAVAIIFIKMFSGG